MDDNNTKLPVGSDNMRAGIEAGLERIKSVPTRSNLIDNMSDEDWLSDDPETWNIGAGSENGNDEIDDLDAKVSTAA